MALRCTYATYGRPPDGETLHADMLEAIESAQDSILMKTFIWKDDEVGQRFIDAFNAAARRRVKVFIGVRRLSR